MHLEDSRRRWTTALFLAAATILALAPCTTALAQVVSGSQISFIDLSPPQFGAQYSAGVHRNLAGGVTAVWFAYTGVTLSVTATLTDESSDWYVTSAGDASSAGTVAANQFPIIFAADKYRPPVTIPLGDFYLGVNTGSGFTDGFPNRQVFGWLELDNTGSELIPVANAVDYGDGGIIVGTTTGIPEPASLMVLGVVMPLLARRRRVGRFFGARGVRRMEQ